MDTLFNYDFWNKIVEGLFTWAKSEGIGILILTLLCLIALRLNATFFKRFGKVLIKRATNSKLVDPFEAEKRILTLNGILHSIVKVLIWIIFIINILKKINIDIAPILASAGILGLAVGFGAQELVRDIISGFFILLENQVRTGDFASINQTPGLVEKIELRTITLRDTEGVVHVFQNGKINSLSNMTKEWSAINFHIRVAYKEDVSKVMAIMKAVGDEIQNDANFTDKILEPINILGLDKFTYSALVIRARFKTKPSEQWSIGREYRQRLKLAFEKENIEIPFPQTAITWNEQKPIKKVTNE
ncbi:MAG: mechanosensitive ion channel family protein [Salinivirgaceae bacterium]|nr:mechanosensitive ion channel family protein [Salinivirgaceae bacterium]MDY0280894.1 mechanosensitive ion channel family protein [Salinivirgaceae bacterium]